MVKIEPATGTAVSVVKLGFVLRNADPMVQDSRRRFHPEFLEIRYQNDHDGNGWSWMATVRGRRINKGGRLGAADAYTWFHSRRSGRYGQTMPEWVLDTVARNMPGKPELPASHPDARQSVKLGRSVTGMWRGRVQVTAGTADL